MKFPICEKEIDYSVSSQVSRDYNSLDDEITFKIYIVKSMRLKKINA